MHLVPFDLETTGLNRARDEIIQIAAVRMRDGRLCAGETFATFVQPVGPIPPEITGYTGITRAHVQAAPPAPEALRAFSHFVGDGILVAHNARSFRSFASNFQFLSGSSRRPSRRFLCSSFETFRKNLMTRQRG